MANAKECDLCGKLYQPTKEPKRVLRENVNDINGEVIITMLKMHTHNNLKPDVCHNCQITQAGALYEFLKERHENIE